MADETDPTLERDQMRAVAQVQRWHDFKAHVGAYVLINAVLVGLSSQHFLNSFAPVTDERGRRELRRSSESPHG